MQTNLLVTCLSGRSVPMMLHVGGLGMLVQQHGSHDRCAPKPCGILGIKTCPLRRPSSYTGEALTPTTGAMMRVYRMAGVTIALHRDGGVIALTRADKSLTGYYAATRHVWQQLVWSSSSITAGSTNVRVREVRLNGLFYGIRGYGCVSSMSSECPVPHIFLLTHHICYFFLC